MTSLPKSVARQRNVVSFKCRLVLLFCYWLTQVFLKKRPLNRCSVVVIAVVLSLEIF